MNLKKLKINEKAIVKEILGEKEIRRRILDMGITPGTEVKVEKIAPFGDPIVIKVRGYELSIIKEDAENIIIKEK